MEDNVGLEELINVSMQIILHAGNAQTYAQKAIEAIQDYDFDSGRRHLLEADKEIVYAHKIQTDTIQKEARGERIEYLSLFSHAQDTLMTIKSEIKMIRNLLTMIEGINQRLDKMEDHYENN